MNAIYYTIIAFEHIISLAISLAITLTAAERRGYIFFAMPNSSHDFPRYPCRSPRRPPRLPVIFQNLRPFYFITFNTCKRAPILANDAIHEAFILFCRRAGERGIAVGRYVIMPDHIHLFLAFPPDSLPLQTWVQSIKAVLGKTLLALGHERPHRQEGVFDHLLRSGESYGLKWDYVRKNPVRADLVVNSDDWPYQGEIQPIAF